MATITTASAQWASRPADERFISLDEMSEHFRKLRQQSRAVVAPTRQIAMVPTQEGRNLALRSPQGIEFEPTHFAFGQLATLAGAPAGYLRKLPAPIACDAMNYGLRFEKEAGEVGLLLHRNGSMNVRAATGPNYGRIWNADIVDNLVARFGDGVTGQWCVPGEFGKHVDVTRENTTLYAGDRDMFVFLCDERNRIDIPNRRDGKSGGLARGFFMWNSEVGSATFGLATFLFDFVCQNRIVWGAEQYAEVKIRHTAGAPDKYIDAMVPALNAYANASSRSITDAINNARQARLSGSDGTLDKFLSERFGARMSATLQQVHVIEEGRPIENLWDVTTAVTAQARSIAYQDERVALEREGGKILALASK